MESNFQHSIYYGKLILAAAYGARPMFIIFEKTLLHEKYPNFHHIIF